MDVAEDKGGLRGSQTSLNNYSRKEIIIKSIRQKTDMILNQKDESLTTSIAQKD